jgi:Uma2 family endonuclease
MEAKPLEAGARARFPWRPPFTVDLLFELASDDLRFEVLGGSLVVTPAAEPRHNLAADRLGRIFAGRLPPDLEAITASAIRMPNGDGPIPDLMVTSGDPDEHLKGMPSDLVHTVVEVVSPGNASDDRVKKAGLYASAGIPCYWRVELRPWRQHMGPVPAIVVRLLGEDGDWHETLAAAGTTSTLPVAIDRAGGILPVTIDPAVLVGRRQG